MHLCVYMFILSVCNVVAYLYSRTVTVVRCGRSHDQEFGKLSPQKKSVFAWLADDAKCLWMGIGRLTCLLTVGKKVYKC